MTARTAHLRWLARRATDKAAEVIADHLPEPVVYWASIRLIAFASTGRYSSQVVPELFAVDALRRWPYPPLRVIGDGTSAGSLDDRGVRYTAHPERIDERGGYDDRDEAPLHDCVWCPVEVRDLFACAHNAAIAVAAAREGAGEWPRAYRKVTELIECLEKCQPDLDAHFAQIRPPAAAPTRRGGVPGLVTLYVAAPGTPPPGTYGGA